jgi:hypothetical protein
MAGCAANRAEADYDYGDSRFTVEPRMRIIPDTDVYYIRDASEYDVYQFEGTWYLNDNSEWFRASSWRGPFVSIRPVDIPIQIATVPAGYRRNWVAVERNYRNRDLPENYRASARKFQRKPDMVVIAGTSVRYARRADDYDLYRYRGTWYLVEAGVWHRSSSWRGPFLSIRANSVPREVRMIPRSYRRFWTD